MTLGYNSGLKQKNDFLSGNGYIDNFPLENSNITCAGYQQGYSAGWNAQNSPNER